MHNGFLNLYKPRGLTAHDCVAQLRKLLGEKKIGHAGTLDPMAEGVLPIAVGKYTRLLSFLSGGKSYRAVIQLGMVTDTDDITGRIIQQQPVDHLTLEQIQPYLSKFVGTYQQRPPAYSAIHLHGKRLYELARSQTLVTAEIPLRTVAIYAISVVDWQGGATPQLVVTIDCGSGTYIRSIARDLGEMIGCGATLAGLVRTSSNGFHLRDSLTLETIARGKLTWIPADQALAHLQSVTLSPTTHPKWQKGQPIPTDQTYATQYLVTYNPMGDLAGISSYQSGQICPKVVF